MRRIFFFSTCALALAACQDAGAPTAPGAGAEAPSAALLPASGGRIDPELSALLAGAAPTDRLVVIVNFDEALTSAPVLAGAARALGASVVPLKHLSMLLVLAAPAQVPLLAALPGVQGVYDDGRDRVLLRESIASMRADLAVNAGVTGKGVGIAILDSGVNGLNPDVAYPGKTVANVKFTARPADLVENDGTTPRVGGGLFVENVQNTDNSSGHGTHVAGITAGSGASTNGAYRGVAPGAHIVGLSVGEGLSIINTSVLMAVDWLLENGAKYNVQVVNSSWGSNGEYDPADPVNEAMSRLHRAGMTVVFAGGNEGPAPNTMNRRSVNPDVISVAAGCKLWVLDPTNSASQCQDAGGRAAVLAGFSSRGIEGDAMWKPDVTAPGVRIVSTRSATGSLMNGLDAPDDVRTCNIGVQNLQNYTCASGTSMAAPHVAGVVALMEEASGGRLKPDAALAILQRTARPLAGYAEWEVGAGYVDAWAAVQEARALASSRTLP